MPSALGGGAPDMERVRAARSNIRYHLRYIGYLTSRRNWLAGNRLSYADLAAAAHLSSVDFLGDGAMGRGRNGEALVRAGEIAAGLSRASDGPAAGPRSGASLRGSRLLDASFKGALAAKARSLGFDLCRVADPGSIAQAGENLTRWLDMGAAGDMDWMEETGARRADPRRLWPDVKSIILLGMNYGPAEDPLTLLADRTAANLSVYARNRDYHDLIKGRLKLLAAWLVAQTAGGQVKVFVDTAPVMEKPLAEKAGLGWQGKHTNLVSRDFGSWLFLGSIFTDLPLEADAAEEDHCGSCQACLDICPTMAFPAPYVLDARRCISYLTIEHRGRHSARIPRGDRQPDLWMRRLPRRLSVE